MPGPLISQKDIGTAAVTFQKRDFSKTTGKARQARVHFTFTSANVAVSMPHSLGRVPTSFTVVASGRATLGTAPGVIYSDSTLPGQTLNASKNYLVLACETGTTWAEVLIQ